MEFTKNTPPDLGKLACVINASIEIKKLDIPKVESVSISLTNKALLAIGHGYQSANDLEYQWVQMVDMLTKIDLTKEETDNILKLAKQKSEILRTSRKLT